MFYIKDGDFYTAQCLNVEVASFGKTIDEAVANVTEALELCFEDDTEPEKNYIPIEIAMLGEKNINA